MPKIKAQANLVKAQDFVGMDIPWTIRLVNAGRVFQDLVDKFVKSDTVTSVHMEVEFKSVYQEKTHSQLGYMHAAIWPQFYRYYEEQGIPAETEEQKDKIRDDIKLTIGFTELFKSVKRKDDIYPAQYDRPRSFAGASKEETSQMIKRLLVLAADFGILIEGPEEYKERHGINELT